MKNKLQLLVMPNVGESDGQATQKAFEQLNQLPAIKGKWDALDKMDKEAYTFLDELGKFHEEFSFYWLLSSPRTISCFGEKICFEIFELFLKWKDSVLSIEALSYYEELPEELIIFRGGAGSVEQIVSGHSWTLNHALAANYAKQHDGCLVSARLAKINIIFLVPEEDEIIPRRASFTVISCVQQE